MKRAGQWVVLWLAIISTVILVTILSTLLTFPIYAHMDDLPQIAAMSLRKALPQLLTIDGLPEFPLDWDTSNAGFSN